MTDLIAELACSWDAKARGARREAEFAQAGAFEDCAEELRAHAAEIEAMARDAEFGRAMKEAMKAEYTAAKQMRGKRQQEWVTTYCLLLRLKSAAAHLSDAAMRSAKEDGK